MFAISKVRLALNFLHDCILSNLQLHLDLKAIVCPYNAEALEIMEIKRNEIQTQINTGTCSVCFVEVPKQKLRAYRISYCSW